MSAVARGWAVVEDEAINVRSVAPTRTGAIVNWLCTEKRLLVLRETTQEQIERMWQANKGAAEVEAVQIERLKRTR